MLHKALQLTMPTNIYGNPDISPMCKGLIFPVPVLTAGEVLPAKKGVGAGVGPMGHHCQMTPSMNKYYSNSLVCLNMKYHISDFKSILQACPCIHRDSIPECPPQQIQASVSYLSEGKENPPASKVLWAKTIEVRSCPLLGSDWTSIKTLFLCEIGNEFFNAIWGTGRPGGPLDIHSLC